jgi:hypothetical protein
MIGDDFDQARRVWKTIGDHTFTEGDLEALLLAVWKKWQPGTLSAELSRALLEESESTDSDPDPAALLLADIEHLPKTSRIDGILPLTIPRPNDVHWTSDALIDEVVRLKIGRMPEDRDRLRDELALAHLSLLHRRALTSTHRLDIVATLASPGPALVMLGKLPLGGTVTLFTSSLATSEFCLIDRAAVEHHSRFQLHRTKSGKLTLTAGKPRPPKRKDKWTFRL